MRLVEIRSYKLNEGACDKFHAIVLELVMPMLHRWKADVVAFGPSTHEPGSYFLVRAYGDLADRAAQQDAFYGSSEWRDGPREAIISRIETHLSTVLWMSEDSVEDLRGSNSNAGAGSSQGVHPQI